METTVNSRNTGTAAGNLRGGASDKTGAALDRAGATASLLCAIHCALLPLALTLLPLAGIAVLADERVDWAMIGVSAVLGVSSLCLGYRRHRSRRALAFLSAGIALLVLGHYLKEHHRTSDAVAAILLAMGGVTIAASHYLNRRLCNSCVRCHDDESCGVSSAAEPTQE